MYEKIEVTKLSQLVHKLDEALNTYFDCKYIETDNNLVIKMEYVGEEHELALHTLTISKKDIETKPTKDNFISIINALAEVFKNSIKVDKMKILRHAYINYVPTLTLESKEMQNIPSQYLQKFKVEDLKDFVENESTEYTLVEKKVDYLNFTSELIESIYNSNVVRGNHIFANFKSDNDNNALDYVYFNVLKAFRQNRACLKYANFSAEKLNAMSYDNIKYSIRDTNFVLVYVRGINLIDEYQAVRKIYNICTENKKQLFIFSKPTVKALFRTKENNIIAPDNMESSIYLKHHGLVRSSWEV